MVIVSRLGARTAGLQATKGMAAIPYPGERARVRVSVDSLTLVTGHSQPKTLTRIDTNSNGGYFISGSLKMRLEAAIRA
jgi:hypothetical protein